MVIMLVEVPPMGKAARPCKMSEGIFGHDSNEGWAARGVALWAAFLQSSLLTRNSSPSQARFNPDGSKLQLLRTDSPKSITLMHWDWTFTIFGCDIGALEKMLP
jgi:hypothetical protein